MATVRVKGQQILVQHEGHEFEVWIGEDNHFYLYDPNLLLDVEHVALPTTRRQVSSVAPGLGDIARTAVTNIVPAALSFVPVVGPVLGAVAAAIMPLTGSLFGGNDPTPMDSLQQRAIALRQAIVALNTQLGIPDAMPTLPAGHSYNKNWPDQPIILELYPQNIGITDPNHWRCGKEPGVSCPGCGGIRVCSYDVIARLTPIYESKTQQVHDKTLTANVLAQVGQGGGVAPSAVASPSGVVQSAPTLIGAGPGYYAADSSGAPAPVSAGTLQASMLSDAQGLLPLAIAGIALIVTLAQSKGNARVAQRRRS